MKRTMALILALVLALGVLAGCQREEPDLTPSEPPAGDTNQGDTTTPSEPDTSSDTPLPEGEGTLRVAVNADISTPVSYTHLDVYKRQQRGRRYIR